MLLAVRLSSYGCTWEVWRALKKLELHSATPRATLRLLSCSPNFPRASITRYTHAKQEPILKYTMAAKPIKSLKLYYTMIQFLINNGNWTKWSSNLVRNHTRDLKTQVRFQTKLHLPIYYTHFEITCTVFFFWFVVLLLVINLIGYYFIFSLRG